MAVLFVWFDLIWLLDGCEYVVWIVNSVVYQFFSSLAVYLCYWFDYLFICFVSYCVFEVLDFVVLFVQLVADQLFVVLFCAILWVVLTFRLVIVWVFDFVFDCFGVLIVLFELRVRFMLFIACIISYDQISCYG